MSNPTPTIGITDKEDDAAIKALLSLGHNPRNYDQPVLPFRHPSTYVPTARSTSGSPSFASASSSASYGPLTALPTSIATSSTTTITASSSSRSCSLPLISSLPYVSDTSPRYLQSGGSSQSIPGSRLNERRGSGRLSGPGSRDILDFRCGGDGDGVGDGDGYGDNRGDGAEGDGSGDGDDHRSRTISEPGTGIEDEAEVRTIRGFGGPDEDDLSSTSIRIGIGDTQRYAFDHNAGGGGEGGRNGGNTEIRDTTRVDGEDPHLHLRSRSDMTMEVDLRSRPGMEVDLGMDRDRDRNRDMLMSIDPDMVGLLKMIYGWGDREVSPHSSLFSCHSTGRVRRNVTHSGEFARLISLLLLLLSPSHSDYGLPPRQLQAIGTRHLQIWSEYPNHPESAGWRKRLPYIRFKRKRKIKMEVVSSDGSGEEEEESDSHSEEAEFGCK